MSLTVKAVSRRMKLVWWRMASRSTMPGKGDDGQDRCYDAAKTGNCHGNKNVFHFAKMSRYPTKLRSSTVGVSKNQSRFKIDYSMVSGMLPG